MGIFKKKKELKNEFNPDYDITMVWVMKKDLERLSEILDEMDSIQDVPLGSARKINSLNVEGQNIICDWVIPKSNE